MAKGDRSLPLVYSCSGCSSAAQMANYVAICLDRGRHAEMSCIAGVGGGVASLVRIAKVGRPIIAIDGCTLHCVRACLVRHDVEPSVHVTLTELGVKKRFHMEFSEDEAVGVLHRLVNEIESGALVEGRNDPRTGAEG